MGALLIFVGVIWAIIGMGNIIGMSWSGGNNSILTFGILINMVFFIVPGLGLAGLGQMIRRKAEKERE